MKKMLFVFAALCTLTACNPVPSADMVTDDNGKADRSDAVLSPADYDYKDYVTLGEYKGFSVEVPTIEVTEEEVDKQLSDLQKSNMQVIPTAKTEVHNNDLVNLSYTIYYKGDATDNQVEEQEVRLGDSNYPKDFEDSLVGVTVNQEVDIPVKLEDDYYDSDLAGKTVTFRTQVHSIDEEVLPEITDEWIASVSDCSTLSEWRDKTRATLQNSKKQVQNSILKQSVQATVLNNCKFADLPQELVDDQVKSYQESDKECAESLGIEADNLWKEYYGYDTEEQYLEELKEYVCESIKIEFALNAIRDAEGIVVTQDDIDSFVENCLQDYNISDEEELHSMYDEETIKTACANKKVWDTICGTVTVIESTGYEKDAEVGTMEE